MFENHDRTMGWIHRSNTISDSDWTYLFNLRSSEEFKPNVFQKEKTLTGLWITSIIVTASLMVLRKHGVFVNSCGPIYILVSGLFTILFPAMMCIKQYNSNMGRLTWFCTLIYGYGFTYPWMDVHVGSIELNMILLASLIVLLGAVYLVAIISVVILGDIK